MWSDFQSNDEVSQILTLVFFSICAFVVFLFDFIVLLPLAIATQSMRFQWALNGHRSLVWWLINLGFLLIFHFICLVLKHIPKIPSIVANIVGFLFAFIYECLFYIFLMWLSGGVNLNRSFCLIVVIHLFPMRLAHLLAGLTD